MMCILLRGRPIGRIAHPVHPFVRLLSCLAVKVEKKTKFPKPQQMV